METLAHTFFAGSQDKLPPAAILGAEGVPGTDLSVDDALSQMSPQDPRRGGSNPNTTIDYTRDRVAPLDLRAIGDVQVDL